MTVISLTTDFGEEDGYVGVMKGVIWSIDPSIQIADISHAILPQNILQGAVILARSAKFFPPGSIHVAVVDPGVGTTRLPIVIQLGDQIYVGPDNGLFTLVVMESRKNNQQERFFTITESKYWLPGVSQVFHGRDIFAPVAAHIAKGIKLDKIGREIKNIFLLSVPKPEKYGKKILGNVLYIDHFGNISTNISTEDLGGGTNIHLIINGREFPGISRTFAEKEIGEFVLYFGSSGNLNLGKVNGNAARDLKVEPGDPVHVKLL